MPELDRENLQKITSLLTPLLETEAQRRALLLQAFPGEPILKQIDYTSAVSVFVPSLISQLNEYGEIEDGKPALDLLLKTARGQLGKEQQRLIDALLGRSPDGTDPDIPPSPEPYIKHPYILSRDFFGRKKELARLDEWAESRDSTTMIVEAIGGMGKSALTWQWLCSGRAEEHIPDFAGAIWWSFYESDAAVTNFTRHALAYVTGQPLKTFDEMSLKQRIDQLRQELQRKPYLLVLDGLERILVAYHRMDSAQMSEDEVEEAEADRGRNVRACIDPQAGQLLQLLTQCAPSKVLISTRLTPRDLENRAGTLMPGIRCHELNGMHPDDALAMMRHLGITGDEKALDDFMKQFGYHSLLLGVVAGMINRDFRARGDFDSWYARKGHNLRLSELDLKQRRTHILEFAMQGLRPEQSLFLSQLSAFRYSVDFAAMLALNPYRPPKPKPNEFENQQKTWQVYQQALHEYENSPEVRQADERFEEMLFEIEERGLLHYKRDKGRFDLHPIVRAYAFEQLEGDARAATFERIRDHFESTPLEDLDQVTEVWQLRRTLEIYWALVGAGRLDDAARLFRDRLGDLLRYHITSYYLTIELLTSLFPNGVDHPPALEDPSRQSYVVTDLAAAFYHTGQNKVALTLRGLQLKLKLDHNDISNLCVGLRNYANSLFNNNQLAAALCARELARDLAAAAGDDDELAYAHRYLLFAYVDAGRWEEAEAAYEAFSAAPPREQTKLYQSEADRYRAMMLVYRAHPDTPAALDRAEALSEQGRNALGLRQVQRYRGEWALLQGDPDAAAKYFREAIKLARKAGSDEWIAWMGGLARAHAAAGQHDEARALLPELNDLDAAEVYLALGEHAEAEEYALKAYEKAWADGPPHIWWWGLERAKRVLATLGVDEPDLPPFDPDKVEPIPYEDEIRALIAELEAEKEED